MQSCIIFSVFVGACLVLVSGNETPGNEEVKFLIPNIIINKTISEPVSVADSNEDVSLETSGEDEKTLLPMLALKPLVIAGGLMAGNKFSKKKPNTQANRPATPVNRPAANPQPENNILISISEDEQAQIIEEEARKLLLPLLTMKPLLFASLLAGSKLPAGSIPPIPKPGIGFTITKHESAKNPPTTTHAPTTTTSTQTPPTNSTPPTPPTNNNCPSLNGFPCYRLPSGCVCLISTQKPWVDAFNYCSANGRKLISIQGVAKQLEIKTYLSSVIGKEKDDIFEFVGFWTSGIYALTAYTWASIPQYFTYTNWIPGQPDNTNLPRATCIRAVPAESYQWDDIDCGQFLPFICE